MEIRSELKLVDSINQFETIFFRAEELIAKLESSNLRLNRADKSLLIDAVHIIYEIKMNQV